MIVTFRCKHAPDIVMFGHVAQRLLRMSGHSATVPGAWSADEVGGALERLRAALADLADEAPAPDDKHQDDDEERRPVSLQHRALPLLEMLEAAVANQAPVMWR